VLAELKQLRGAKSKGKGRKSKALASSTVKGRLKILNKAFQLENVARAEAKQDLLIVPQWPKLANGQPRDGFLERLILKSSVVTCQRICRMSRPLPISSAGAAKRFCRSNGAMSNGQTRGKRQAGSISVA
jgi:hypothetical protein